MLGIVLGVVRMVLFYLIFRIMLGEVRDGCVRIIDEKVEV